MSDMLLTVFFIAHLISWLLMGATWRAAFLAPVAVVVPTLATLLAGSVLFDGFAQLPAVFGVIASFEVSLVFGLLCLRMAVPRAPVKAAS